MAPRGTRLIHPLRGAGERSSDTVKRAVRVGADSLNRRQADDDDQGQHHRILHRGRTIFTNQELANVSYQVPHDEPFLTEVTRLSKTRVVRTLWLSRSPRATSERS